MRPVGAFRVVSSRDLRDHDGGPADPRSGDLRHLREQGLVETTRVPGYRDHAVSLTKAGRSLLESHRDRDQDHQQSFYAGLARERELEHDLQLYRAYEQAEARLPGSRSSARGHLAAELPTNEFCLFPSRQAAVAAGESFSIEQPEPGDYYVVEVLELTEARSA